MSIQPFKQQTSFFSVGSLADSLFDQDSFYRLFRQKIYPLLIEAREELIRKAGYNLDRGRPANEPVVMLGMVLFEFLQRVPDRQAMDNLQYHLGWKFALDLEVDEVAYHPTSLVYFRQRLLEHPAARLAFDTILNGLVNEGFLPKKHKQRLDSTHVIGLVAKMNILERVRQTIRLALEQIASKISEQQRPDRWSIFMERYVEFNIDYRIKEEVYTEKIRLAGEDILIILETWIAKDHPELQSLEQVQLLKRVFAENFQREDQKVTLVEKHGAGCVQNPHDPEATWSAKGHGSDKKEWIGYKVQVAESVEDRNTICKPGEPTPNFLTAIITQPAIHSDEAGMEKILQEQKEMGLDQPSSLYVDGAYISAQELAKASADQRELMGPAQPSAHKAKGFRTESFHVNLDQKQASCPAQKTSTQCSRLQEAATGKVSYRFEWSTHCHECPLRDQCHSPEQHHRTLVVGEHHMYLQARRIEQNTEEFKNLMKRRHAIEGTQSELVRAFGLRKSRYRGLAKVTLQNYLIGAACNIKRWLTRITWEINHPSSPPSQLGVPAT